MENKSDKKKEAEAIKAYSVFVLWLMVLLLIIAVLTIAIGMSVNSWQVTTYGFLLFLPVLFVEAVYRRLVVVYLRKEVEQ